MYLLSAGFTLHGCDGKDCSRLKPGAFSGLPAQGQGPKHLGHLPLSRRIIRELDFRWHLGLVLEFLWDAGVAGGGLMCYATASAPHFILGRPR